MIVFWHQRRPIISYTITAPVSQNLTGFSVFSTAKSSSKETLLFELFSGSAQQSWEGKGGEEEERPYQS